MSPPDLAGAGLSEENSQSSQHFYYTLACVSRSRVQPARPHNR